MGELVGTPGERIKHLRTRAGMSRPVLGGLVGPQRGVGEGGGDRAIAEAQEADDPYAIAGGAWALNHALRDTGRWDEAVTVALEGARQLEPWLTRIGDDDWRGLWAA